MEEILKSSLLDEIFEKRLQDGFETFYLKLYGNKKDRYFETLENQLEILINNSISNENLKEEILNSYEKLIYEQKDYWNNIFYKLGFIDGIKMAKEGKIDF